MQKICLFIFLAISVMAVSQQKVAIYVTAPESLDAPIKEIIGSELVSGIVLNKDYVAVERTSDFLKEIVKEQDYQRSGNVDDAQISEIGRQLGADIVCVANITPFKTSYYLTARLIDVETAMVIVAAKEIAVSDDLSDLVAAAEGLSSKLVGVEAKAIKEAAEELPKEYSVIQSGNPYMQPVEIDNTGTYARFTFKFATPYNDKIKVSLNSYAKDDKTGIKYHFLGATGINADEWTPVEAGIHTFTLTCEKLPDNIESLTLYQDATWNWVVKLVPYGKKNYYRFEDNMMKVYDAAVRTLEEQQQRKKEFEEKNQAASEQLNETLGSLAQSIANVANPTYFLLIVNNCLHARNVYVDGQYVGEVGGLSTYTFQVPCQYYKEIKLVQKNYLFSPEINRFTNNTRPTANVQVKIVNNP